MNFRCDSFLPPWLQPSPSPVPRGRNALWRTSPVRRRSRAGGPCHEDRRIVKQVDSAPYEQGGAGNWFVDRETTTLPMCSVFDDLGGYSLRSYMLQPIVTTSQFKVCQATGKGDSVPFVPADAKPRPADTTHEVYFAVQPAPTQDRVRPHAPPTAPTGQFPEGRSTESTTKYDASAGTLRFLRLLRSDWRLFVDISYPRSHSLGETPAAAMRCSRTSIVGRDRAGAFPLEALGDIQRRLLSGSGRFQTLMSGTAVR